MSTTIAELDIYPELTSDATSTHCTQPSAETPAEIFGIPTVEFIDQRVQIRPILGRLSLTVDRLKLATLNLLDLNSNTEEKIQKTLGNNSTIELDRFNKYLAYREENRKNKIKERIFNGSQKLPISLKLGFAALMLSREFGINFLETIEEIRKDGLFK